VDWRPRFADAYRIELQSWVDAVTTGGRSPLPTAPDGLTAAAVADAVIGPLLDLGTYPVSFATWVLGPPARVLAPASPTRPA
jgi:myo-inositol 2-dehydrogenase / D-chiro-inositol 1-dehydrogenase